MQIQLPEKYINRMKEMLGNDYEQYVESLNSPDKSGIRLNTLKLDTKTFKKISSINLREIPWIDNGFFYGEGDIPSKHPHYYAGLYYIQEPSAMTPAFLFDVEPGDKVLDLCAAPGGKSTALAAKLNGKGVLVSNDVSSSRAKALLKNIELFGVRNALVLSESTSKLAERFNEYFDKILVDAPCSGEGMFRKQPSIIKNWEQYGTGYYAKLQREILPDAVKMLKPGGKILFSTCTFSPEEDEDTVNFLLDKFPELELVDIIPERDKEKYYNLGFDTGHDEWASEPATGMEKTVRLWPHKIEGAGHFIAVFKKKSLEELEHNEQSDEVYFSNILSDESNFKELASKKNVFNAKILKETEPSDELTEFMSHISSDFFDRSRYNISLIFNENRYYLVSNELPDLKGLRILRNGLLLGEQKKGRFEPSQALACALKCDEYDNVYNLSSDDADVIKYLKCESIDIKDENVHDGWVLVACDGFSLGFGKLKNGVFKNKYLPGWRLM